jgi:hypothetical protein
MAYRMRAVWLILSIMDTLRQQGLKLPPPPGAAVRPVRIAELLPRVAAGHASAVLPLTVGPHTPDQLPGAPAADEAAAATSVPGATEAAAAAAAMDAGPTGTLIMPGRPQGPAPKQAATSAEPRRSPSPGRRAPRGALGFLPAARTREAMVPLTIRLAGTNLHLVKYVSVQALGEVFVPTLLSQPRPSTATSDPGASQPGDAATSSSGAAARGLGTGAGPGRQGGTLAAPQQPQFARLSRLVHAFAGGARQAAAQLSQYAAGSRPAWRPPPDVPGELTLQVGARTVC